MWTKKLRVEAGLGKSCDGEKSGVGSKGENSQVGSEGGKLQVGYEGESLKWGMRRTGRIARSTTGSNDNYFIKIFLNFIFEHAVSCFMSLSTSRFCKLPVNDSIW